MGEMFDRISKYVLTRGDAPLEWQNSHRVESLEALAELKRGDGPDLVIQGSSTLYPQLLAAGLIDRLTLMTFRLILGRGKRLFGEGTPARTMTMVEHKVSADGNIIATYEPEGEVQTGTFASPEPSPAEMKRREQLQKDDW